MSMQKSFVKLREILAFLYPEKADARRIAHDANLDVSRISLSDKSIDNWDAIIHEAQKDGMTSDLMTVTLREYKANEKLSKAWHDYLVALGSQEVNIQFDLSSNRKPFLPFRGFTIAVVGLMLLGVSAMALIVYNFTIKEIQNPPSVTFEVFASLSWQPTKVQVKRGEKVKLTYITGKWKLSSSPDAELTDPMGSQQGVDRIDDPECHFPMFQREAGSNALVAKIGEEGDPFNPFKISQMGEGMLYLRANDCDKHLGDNSGSVIVQIELTN